MIAGSASRSEASLAAVATGLVTIGVRRGGTRVVRLGEVRQVAPSPAERPIRRHPHVNPPAIAIAHGRGAFHGGRVLQRLDAPGSSKTWAFPPPTWVAMGRA